MKKITSMFDSKLQETYNLYQINARELVKLIQESYQEKGMTSLFVQRFNGSASFGDYEKKYGELMRTVKAMKAHVKNPYHSAALNLNEREERMLRFEKAFEEGNVIQDEQNIAGSFGYELMPFVLSAKGKDIQGQELEMLDGFRRVFYVADVPDQDVLVKVYDHLDNRKWINAMMVFNSWKFAHAQGKLIFLDRGFKLGLYHRFGIDSSEMYGYGHDDMEHNLVCYIQMNPFDTLWNNEVFADDLRFMEQVRLHRPVFIHKKKRKEEVVNIQDEQYQYQYPLFLEDINNQVFRELGHIRREETRRLESGEVFNRRKPSFEEYLALLQAEDLQEHYVKGASMQVPGFVENHVKKNLYAPIYSMVRNMTEVPSLEQTNK